MTVPLTPTATKDNSNASAGNNPPTGGKKTISDIYDILTNKQAPAHTGQPVYQKFLDQAKWAGASKMHHLFGLKIDDADSKTSSVPLNFGSKASTGMMSDEARHALFQLKCLYNNVMLQAAYKGKTAFPENNIKLVEAEIWPQP